MTTGVKIFSSKNPTLYVISPVLWIRISFNADPDTGSQTSADPDQILPSQKVEFLPYFMYVILIGHKTYGTYLRWFKSLFEGLEIGCSVNVLSISLLLDLDSHSQYTDPDSKRAKTMQINAAPDPDPQEVMVSVYIIISVRYECHNPLCMAL